MDAAAALTLLQLDLDLELPARVADLIGDPLVVAYIRVEFDTELEWIMNRLATPGVNVTLDDVNSLSTNIWGNLPVDLIECPAAANAVEDYLDRIVEIVRGIVIEAPPLEP